MIGFSIAFGSLFSKIWIVYTTSIVKIAPMSSRANKFKLYSIPIVLAWIDILIVTVWSWNDQLRQTKIKLTSEASEENDIIYEPLIEVCESKNENLWIGKT
jgi:hypothetical protein